jgi:IS30 family transposase
LKKNLYTKIADFIGKSKSTISYELNDKKERAKYIPTIAHGKYKKVLHKKDGFSIDNNPKTLKYLRNKFINYKLNFLIFYLKSIPEKYKEKL